MNIFKRAALCAVTLTLASGFLHAGAGKDAPLGRILKSSAGKSILEAEDRVTVIFKKAGLARLGSRFTVYKVTADLMKGGSESEPMAHNEVGTLEVVELKGDRRAVAKVILVTGDLEPGDLLKREAP